MKNLIGMVDFVLWQLTVKQSSSEFKEVIRKFAAFLSLKLELWMFIPCKLVDGVWVVLEEKKPFQDNYFEFQQAEERCLFKGFGVRNGNWLSNGNIDIDEEFCQGLSIESLVKYNLELTPTAQI